MSVDSIEIARNRYQKGKLAFENGQYREAVEDLETASALLAPNSRLAGEVKIWLVIAYEAAGRTDEAIALCEQLKRHPYAETSKEARRLQYILKAPRLKRPQEWMTEIPDLTRIADNKGEINFTGNNSKSSVKKDAPLEVYEDLSKLNTKDNRFFAVALIAVMIILGGLVWFGWS
ncbi:tetratricopeptide repeat protein [Calothrix sp. 336/3]|uniref:tetratricopeptide repeat protein n=1 Tax=Calothrix sp. 336/3 TaxID=1337936 RepID=UPI0004E3A951|nr:tetratricopeptide repeat protein [Calothrix sp. 336/3]AKG20672.1 tetratricopeptide repeat protein [Calothrix sp. 336/3]